MAPTSQQKVKKTRCAACSGWGVAARGGKGRERVEEGVCCCTAGLRFGLVCVFEWSALRAGRASAGRGGQSAAGCSERKAAARAAAMGARGTVVAAGRMTVRLCFHGC